MMDAETRAKALLMNAARMLEYDAASYDLSARFSKRKGFVKTMRAKERERRKLVKLIQGFCAGTLYGRAGK